MKKKNAVQTISIPSAHSNNTLIHQTSNVSAKITLSDSILSGAVSNIAKPVTTLFVTYIRILKFIEFFPANVIWIFSPKHSTSQKGTLS